MKTLVQIHRDTRNHSPGIQEATLSVRGRGKAAVVLLSLEGDGYLRTVEFELKELQAALKGLELSVK